MAKLFQNQITSIIDKIIEVRKKRKAALAESEISDEGGESGKEGFVYVDGKAGYRREGRVSFGQRRK